MTEKEKGKKNPQSLSKLEMKNLAQKADPKAKPREKKGQKYLT